MPKEPTKPCKSLFVTIDTFDQSGNQVGTRVVDMYHYGTKAWLINHTWWAMHNSYTVTQTAQVAVLAQQQAA